MDDPLAPSSSSQTPSQTSQTSIFLGKDGSPLIVFIEASSVEHRPKIVRRLKDYGAKLTSDPLDAQIILVMPATDAGMSFVRDWGSVEGKVILDCSWPKICVDAGRALLEDDHWAACRLQHEGDAGPNPLPTPRNTPVEFHRSRSLLPDSGIYASSSSQSQTPKEKALPPPPPSTSSTDTMPITPTDAIPQSTQPYPAPSSLMQPFASQYTMQMPAMYNPMMTPQMMMMDPGQMQMMAMAHFMAQSNNEAFKTAFQDALNSKIGSHMPSALYNPLDQPSPVQEQALPFPRIPSTSSEGNSKKKRSRSTSPSNRGRSLSILSDSLPPRSSKDKKGKRRAISSSKRRKISPSPFRGTVGSSQKTEPIGNSSQKKVFTTKSGREFSFFVQIDLKNRFNVVDAIKKNGGRIEKDAVNADYMVLYSANKNQKPFKALLESARSAGKPAVPTRFIFDCVNERCLLDEADYEFGSLIKPNSKHSPTKVEQLSSDDDAERKRVARNAREADRRRQSKLDKEAETKAARKIISKTKTEGSPTLKKNHSLDETSLVGRRTPTPPGEHTRQPWGNNYRFSSAEDKFALDYAEILLDRDHTISHSALGSKIHKHLPHHSVASWRSHLTTISEGKIDQWRKRSSIAYRKALRQPGPSSQSAMPKVDVEDSIVIELSSSPVPSAAPHLDVEEQSIMEFNSSPPSAEVLNRSTVSNTTEPDEEDPLAKDIETMAQFYAGALGNNASEEEHWASLVAQHTCRTAPSWDDFYDAHHPEVVARYTELTTNP
ncbi:hypothetical protein GALMADRAFT_233396 [Galerina marginata CBS 339.88]|uniref:BRCT domain-containing protein n=1 Tax=Galerina marginata (strain CBS 339.88) TaxID=685588 RepID=A0A067TP29_GALM3|nr:hypothetical protein GALMADRAFT_233396 [Galerina marginata CBS 339.88]